MLLLIKIQRSIVLATSKKVQISIKVYTEKKKYLYLCLTI